MLSGAWTPLLLVVGLCHLCFGALIFDDYDTEAQCGGQDYERQPFIWVYDPVRVLCFNYRLGCQQPPNATVYYSETACLANLPSTRTRGLSFFCAVGEAPLTYKRADGSLAVYYSTGCAFQENFCPRDTECWPASYWSYCCTSQTTPGQQNYLTVLYSNPTPAAGK